MKNLSLVFRSLALPVLLLTLNAAGAQEKHRSVTSMPRR